MSASCREVEAFFDGELDAASADRFRDHLPDCERCQAQLADLAQLAALAHEARAAERPKARVIALAPARPRRRRFGAAIAVAAAAAAAVVAVLALRAPGGGDEIARLVATRRTRGIEARLGRAEADAWRPYDVQRGSDRAPEAAPLAELASLEARRDYHGVATAWLLAGDPRRADAYLERASPSPAVENDRAVVALARGDLEEALVRAEAALASAPKNPQALWNRGLALRDLGLELLAADSFQEVAALGEPGWAEEAKQRADALTAQAGARRDSWWAARKAGGAMVAGGAPVGDELARAHPGVVQLYLYHALRAAPSRERALALAPLAATLDAQSGGDRLQRAVRAVAGADFAVRAPLARTYSDLYGDAAKVAGPARAAYLDRLRRARQPDILLGALVLTDEVPAHLDEFHRLSVESGDPWYLYTDEHEQAKAEVARGELLQAERRLLAALPACHQTRIEYRCGYLEHELALLYVTLHRPVEARRVASDGWAHARQAGEWGFEALFLQDLASAARFRSGFALARAYLDETLRRQLGKCEVEQYVRLQSAMLDLDALRPEEARRDLARAPLCGKPLQLAGADLLAELAHFAGTDDESARAQAALRTLREGGALSPGQRALADEMEGRLLLERGRAEAKPLLDRAIASAAALPPWDVEAQKARSFSYSGLVHAAGRDGRWGDALDLLAAELGADPPRRCAVGVATDYDRLLVAARGADGAPLGRWEPHHAGAIVPSQIVGADVEAKLAGCPTVDLFARPPLQGAADLLPAAMAWRYRVGHARPSAPAIKPRRLVVSGIDAPPALGLPRLAPWPSRPSPANGPAVPLTLLEGAAATPSRVLAEMKDASEIELHTHGLVDLGVSDVSLLVLSPDEDGQYALTAGRLRRQRLDGAPLVILAACRAGERAPYHHQPWSLPMAFVEAGASAVLASPSAIQDAEAGPFFEAVRARIRAGEPPAQALRDARVEFLGRDPQSSVKDVVLFE